MTPERSVSRPWTVQEDELLIRAVADHGENDNWKEVAMCIPGRTNEACRKVSGSVVCIALSADSGRVSDGWIRWPWT